MLSGFTETSLRRRRITAFQFRLPFWERSENVGFSAGSLSVNALGTPNFSLACLIFPFYLTRDFFRDPFKKIRRPPIARKSREVDGSYFGKRIIGKALLQRISEILLKKPEKTP